VPPISRREAAIGAMAVVGTTISTVSQFGAVSH
jgi:hypothetical protein